MGYANEQSLILYEGVFKDSMESEKTKSIAEIETTKKANEIILNNNFTKVNKKFETSYIDSENYQINTCKNIDAEYDEFIKKLDVLNTTYRTTMSDARAREKAEFAKTFNSKKTEITDLVNNAVDKDPNGSNPYGIRRGKDVIFCKDLAELENISIEPHKDDFYANYVSGGVSLIDGYGKRIEPFNLSDINPTGMGTAQTPDKSIYFRNDKNGLDLSRRVFPIIEKESYTANLTYPNAKDVKYIRLVVDKPKEYNNDVLLYSGSDYNVYLKHPVKDLFAKDIGNIIFIDCAKNEVFINGFKILKEAYYNKHIPLVEPIAMYTSYRANTGKTFVKEDLLDILGKEPVGYATVTMDPDTGIFSNPEGTCQGQLVLEKEKCLVCQGNVLDDESINGKVHWYDPSMCNFTPESSMITKCDGYNRICVDGTDGYRGGSVRLSNYSIWKPWNTSASVDVKGSEDIYFGARLVTTDIWNDKNGRHAVWNNMYYPTPNQFQLCVNNRNYPTYDNDVIMWKNLKYSEHAICDSVFTTSHEDIYEEKVYKKIFYGSTKSTIPLNNKKLTTFSNSSITTYKKEPKWDYYEAVCGDTDLQLYATIVSNSYTELGKSYTYIIPYFKNLSKCTLRIRANASHLSINILPGEEVYNIYATTNVPLYHLVFQVVISTLEVYKGAKISFIIDMENICLYEGTEKLPFFKGTRPETIIDFVE